MSIDEIGSAVKAYYGVPRPDFYATAKAVFGAQRWVTRDGRHAFSLSDEAWGRYLLDERYPELRDDDDA